MLGSLSLPHRQGPVSFPPVHLSLGNWIPAEVEFPVKPSVSHVWPSHVFKCVIADHIDDWADNSFPVRRKKKKASLKTNSFFWISHGFILRLLCTKANLPRFQLLFHKWGCANVTISVVNSCLEMLIPAALPRGESCPLLTLPGASCLSAKSSPHGRGDCLTLHPCSTDHSVLAKSPPHFLRVTVPPAYLSSFLTLAVVRQTQDYFCLGLQDSSRAAFTIPMRPCFMEQTQYAFGRWEQSPSPASAGMHMQEKEKACKFQSMGGHRDKK